ncbi:MAG: Wzz/FepE/Etk N-terminal domain-containing protein [Methylococcaceae bacterium]
MKNKNNPNVIQDIPQQYGYPAMYQKEDEIDLYKLFSSIFSQWELLGTITLAGTLLAVFAVLIMPRQYEAVIQIAKPTQEDIKAINTRGYISYSPEQIFIRLYEQVRSADHLQGYIKQGDWYKRVFPDVAEDASEEQLFSEIYSTFEAEILRPKTIKKDIETSVPKLISIKMAGADEGTLVEFINGYAVYTNGYLLEQIEEKGKYSLSLEIEKHQKTIAVLRLDAKVRREFLITKLEAQNKEKITSLENEKKMLLTKAVADKASKIAVLDEAYNIAKTMGIKKPTTLDALATENKSSKTLVSMGANNNQIHALMGTIYLKSELETLKNRQNDGLFITKLAQIDKQIEDIKHDEQLIALKERKSDDPYITELAGLFKQVDQLNRLTFDFSAVQLYRLDQAAYADGIAEKPNRKLIVAVGFVLSVFISLFIVLIITSIKNHKDGDEPSA